MGVYDHLPHRAALAHHTARDASVIPRMLGGLLGAGIGLAFDWALWRFITRAYRTV